MFYTTRFLKEALRISFWTALMWALITYVIGKPLNKDVVSTQTKHIKYNQTGIYFIWCVIVYRAWIRMFKQNMGIRLGCLGNAWAYFLIILRVTSAVCAFFFLAPRLMIIYTRSYEIYDEDEFIYGVLDHHDHWYTALISIGIWCLTTFSLACMLCAFFAYLVFLRIYGFKVAKHNLWKGEKWLLKSLGEFMVGA